MNKIIILIIGLITLTLGISVAQPDTLSNLIDQALEVSPKLKMLEMKKNAALNRVEQNSNLPDPMLGFGFMNLPVNSFSLDQEPMTGIGVGLSQSFPFPGKLSAQAEVKYKDVDIIQQEINDTKNEIKKNVILKLYRIF